MAIKVVNLPRSTSRSQTHTVTIPGLKSVVGISVNTGTASVVKVEGDVVTLDLRNGSGSSEQTGGTYTPADSKSVSVQSTYTRSTQYVRTSTGWVSQYDSGPPPSTMSYNSGGYSGTLTSGGAGATNVRYDGDPNSTTIGASYWHFRDFNNTYTGTVTKPATDTRTYSTFYSYTVTIDYSDNSFPTMTLNTTDNRTLYENDTFGVSGTAMDTDSGNVVNVKYQINGGTIRAITTAISTGAAIPFNRALTFKNSKLYDGETAVTDVLAEGTQHLLKVWAEDDKGGKSAEHTRIFYTVANRPATLTINPFTTTNDLINSDKITISGNVVDPDANTVMVKYKVANGSFAEVYSGTGGAFSFQVALSSLVAGKNTITIQATDSYGAITSKTLSVTKSENTQPLLTSVTRYKLTPPNGSTKGVLLWVEREVGDLTVDAEISMTAEGEVENFVPMTKNLTAYVTDGIEEDEFTYDAGVDKANILVKLTMTRTNTSSDKGIKLISGVLS